MDYGVGNIYSLKALSTLEETVVSKDAKVLDCCSGIVLWSRGLFWMLFPIYPPMGWE